MPEMPRSSLSESQAGSLSPTSAGARGPGGRGSVYDPPRLDANTPLDALRRYPNPNAPRYSPRRSTE